MWAELCGSPTVAPRLLAPRLLAPRLLAQRRLLAQGS
jgi:hypothetical protein